jgi:predicted permease
MLEALSNDLRYGLRGFAKSPGFTIVAVLSLALGIGANTAIFTVIDALMLRSLPVRSPNELFSVGDPSRPTRLSTGDPMLSVFSYPLYQQLRDHNRVFSGLLASGKTGRIDMSVGNGAPEQVSGRLVSGNYFDVLGVEPAIGRVFSGEEDRAPGTSPVIVISYDFWVNHFARDPGILGRTIRLNDAAFTIIGVGPPAFAGEVVGLPADVWIPIRMQAQVNRGDPRLDSYSANWLLCIGRRLPGVTIERARDDLTVLAQQTLRDYANIPVGQVGDLPAQKVEVQAGAKGFSGMRKNAARQLITLMVVVGMLLLIACANVANLLLARATARRKEISVRLAVGASRRRLVRQLLIESVLLGLLGGAAGLLLAGWGSRALLRLAYGSGGSIPLDVSPNATVLAFTAGISFLTAILFGLIPALGSTRLDLASTLKENARSVAGGGWRLGKLLVAGQLALSLLLLIGAGLFIRSLQNLDSLDVGYSRANLVLLNADLPGSGYAEKAQQFLAVSALLERLRSMPGVLGATVSENGIFSGTDSDTDGIRVDGFSPRSKEDSHAGYDQIGAHYFYAVGVALLAGREFDEHDKAGAPAVAILNDTMARFYFGPNDPLGKSIVNGNDRYTVVGVVRDMKERDLKGKAERRFYLPLLQSDDRISAFNFEIRTRGDAAMVVPAVRRELHAFNPNLKIAGLAPVRVLIDRSISQERLIAQLTGFFGVLALLLASNGVYGVMSYAMSRRANEIGIRMALGANRFDVIGMVLRETLVLAAAGFAIGFPAALVATQLISSTLVGLSGTDPATLAISALVMLAMALFAGFIPAQRAARIDPAVTLRRD